MPVSHKLIHPSDTSVDFECALMQLSKAVDSRGLRVRLLPFGLKYAAKNLFAVLHNFFSSHGPYPGHTYIKGDLVNGVAEDPEGELTFARNLRLLVNAYVAAVEHEHVADPTNLKTPEMG